MGLFPHSHAAHCMEGRDLIYLFSSSLVHFGNRYKWFYVQRLFLVMAKTYLVTTDAGHFSGRHSKSSENVHLFIYKLSNIKLKSDLIEIQCTTLIPHSQRAEMLCHPVCLSSPGLVRNIPFTKVPRTSSGPHADATHGIEKG